jgi:hypothetical protein
MPALKLLVGSGIRTPQQGGREQAGHRSADDQRGRGLCEPIVFILHSVLANGKEPRLNGPALPRMLPRGAEISIQRVWNLSYSRLE